MSQANSAPVPYAYKARVTRVVDGDTVVVNIDLGLNVWKHGIHVRLLGVNAPELNTPIGLRCQAYAQELLVWDWRKTLEDALIIRTYKDKGDKYGRLLGELWVNGRNVNLDIQRFVDAELEVKK